MPTHHDHATPLRLDPVHGPEIPHPVVPDGGFATVGRAADCQVCLLHETVSRQHARVNGRAGKWFITDLGSRHGTTINGVRLQPDTPAELANNDMLRIGPWTFRVVTEPATSRAAATIHAAPQTTERIERVPERELSWAAQHRLNLLIECSAAINAAGSEEALVSAALDAALAGSGCQRVAWLRGAGSGAEFDVLGFKSAAGEAIETFSFSQSLIREAAAGQIVRLTEDSPSQYGHSIASLGIHSALCAPVLLGAGVVGYLYFDARGQESPVHHNAAGFCQAVARMCGLALANLKRVELEGRHRRLVADLSAARQAQQLIMPPEKGVIGHLRYALRNKPGRTVAGDLFDIVELPGGGIAVCLGDVSGEGVSAGILMASSQSFLHGALLHYQDAAEALNAANRYLTDRAGSSMFITMWVGIIEPRTGIVRYVDAGHGHWFLRRPGQPPQRIQTSGGIPLAIESEYVYHCETLTLSEGDRLFLFSDGLLEQRSPTGEEFGRQRIMELIAAPDPVGEDVAHLFDEVQRHACTDMLDDDATAASIEFLGQS